MKLFVSALLVLGGLTTSPVVALASTDVAAVCGPDVPEAYKRPGGYCDQIENNKSLGTEPGDGVECNVVDFRMPAARDVTVLVANISSCCHYIGSASMPDTLPQGMLPMSDAILVATPCPP